MGFIVITTIQAPARCAIEMVEIARAQGHRALVVGDRKTPPAQWPNGADFIDLDSQRRSDWRLAAPLPENHYARKNLGYLEAMRRGADFIFDTDDDNRPLPEWRARTTNTLARPCLARGWVNAYRWFSNLHIWPRGLPLEAAHRDATFAPLGPVSSIDAPIQQGLANGSPDVDAVWRLLMDQEVTFAGSDSVALPQGCWCPFNSQSTWWFPRAYPLLYLPSRVSFRMTDIWRSFVAQRCLWAMGDSLVFHGAEMHQDRNPHNLLRDFEQEVPGYLGNERIREVLEGLALPGGAAEVTSNLHRCYAALVGVGLIPKEEMPLLECWIDDIGVVGGGVRT